MIKRKLGEHGGRIFEAKKDAAGRVSFPVVIISQGLGNLVDKNYYSEEAIKSGVRVYNGKKAYYDHPTKTQEEEQPGRSVKEICGHYEDCQAVKNKDGLMELRANFVPMKTKTDVVDLIEHSIEYKKKFPNDEFVGVSICGDGSGKTMEYDEFVKTIKPLPIEMDKIRQIEGQSVNVILEFTEAQSADIVTEAGAKGRYLQESKTKRRMSMFEAMKKFIFGAEKNDSKLMESAVAELEEAAKKASAEDEDEKKKEKKKKEDEDEAKKKEASKDDDADDKKEDEKKKEKKKKEDEDESEDEKKKEAKKKEDEDESEDEKKEAKKKKEDEDDGDHADKKQDVALIKKMMKQMDEMKKEIESLKGKKEEAEKEAKKQHEESAKTKIALQAKERADLIEGMVAKSGLPYSVTEGLKSLFTSKNYSKEEMKKFVETAKETYSKGIDEVLMGGATTGFTEIETTESSKGSNDNLLM
jgi:hypothetical protein